MSSPINIPEIQGEKKKVFLLWFCPVAIVHILSVSNFTAAETQVWIHERLIQGITACLWWCHRHRVVTWQWITKDLFPGLGKVYVFPPTWCEAQSKQKTEEKLMSCIYVKSKKRKAEYDGAWEESSRSLPVPSVLKGNEKTVNRSQLTGLLLRDNQMEKVAQKMPPTWAPH